MNVSDSCAGPPSRVAGLAFLPPATPQRKSVIDLGSTGMVTSSRVKRTLCPPPPPMSALSQAGFPCGC
jgi:hypothetical protein